MAQPSSANAAPLSCMGCVTIIGAGPGRLDYLTVRGQHLLSQAQVLIYDALVDADLQQLVPTTCQLLNVGKRGGQPSTPQAEINRLLVQHCQQGQQVVRLKSGDPFIFGRTTAEIQALAEAGCRFEIVPGISSALAAPLLAGIPLTDPVFSRGFAVVTAHEPGALDWQALAALDTVVVLMGSRQLTEIVHQLERHGRSPHSPIAVIRWAGQPQQQIWTGTLENIVQQTARQSLSPAVIVMGEVVNLRPFLQFELPPHKAATATDQALPLQGKTVLVTRSAGQSSQFHTLLDQAGAAVIEMPALEIGPPSSWADLDEAIAHMHQFHWLILTSSNGVEYFMQRLLAQDKDARALSGIKIAVVGKKTAASLQQYGLRPDFIPPDYVADALVQHFPDGDRLPELRLLFPRVESGGREALVNDFTARGGEVVEVAAYQSGCPRAIAPEALAAIQSRQVDVVTFASSKTVRHFHQLLSQALQADGDDADCQSLLRHVCIASIGPQTSETCREQLGRVDVEAQEYTLEGLTQAVVQWAEGSN